MLIREIDKDFEDLCFKSLNILEEKVRGHLLRDYEIESPWFVDAVSGTNTTKFQETMDIVFFGNYLPRFLESGCWPIKKARFWVLSNSVKNVLVNIVKLPCDSVRVIPREALFNRATKPVVLNSKMTFISASRISETKNIEAFLYTVSILQNKYNLNIKPILSGDFDNMSNLYSIKDDNFSYFERINKIISELPWSIEPEIRNNLNETEWLEKNDESPIFVSLSTFIGEDFGVSLAQAQEKGWPSIISNWGGHRDTDDSYVIKVPVEYLVEESGSFELLKARSHQTAKYIIDKFENLIQSKEIIKKNINFPHKYIEIETIDLLRRSFIERNKVSSLYLSRGQLNKYKALEDSYTFFQNYHKEFGGVSLGTSDIVVIINDFGERIDGVSKFCNTLLSQELSNNKVKFIPINRALKKEAIREMQLAKKVIIPFAKTSMESFFYFLRNMIGKKDMEIYFGSEWNGDMNKPSVDKWIRREEK
jgi:hypothetical protein